MGSGMGVTKIVNQDKFIGPKKGGLNVCGITERRRGFNSTKGEVLRRLRREGCLVLRETTVPIVEEMTLSNQS